MDPNPLLPERQDVIIPHFREDTNKLSYLLWSRDWEMTDDWGGHRIVGCRAGCEKPGCRVLWGCGSRPGCHFPQCWAPRGRLAAFKAALVYQIVSFLKEGEGGENLQVPEIVCEKEIWSCPGKWPLTSRSTWLKKGKKGSWRSFLCFDLRDPVAHISPKKGIKTLGICYQVTNLTEFHTLRICILTGLGGHVVSFGLRDGR